MITTSDKEMFETNVCDDLQISEQDTKPITKYSSLYYKDLTLIRAVRNLPVIFDHSVYSPYKCKQKKTEAWKVISKETQFSADECRMRWRTLRERFARERKHKIGQSKWPLYDEINFISPFVKPRNRLHKKKATYVSEINSNGCIFIKKSESSLSDLIPVLPEAVYNDYESNLSESPNDDNQSDYNSDYMMSNYCSEQTNGDDVTDSCADEDNDDLKPNLTAIWSLETYNTTSDPNQNSNYTSLEVVSSESNSPKSTNDDNHSDNNNEYLIKKDLSQQTSGEITDSYVDEDNDDTKANVICNTNSKPNSNNTSLEIDSNVTPFNTMSTNSSDDQTISYSSGKNDKDCLHRYRLSRLNNEDLLFAHSVAAEINLIANRKQKIKLKAEIFRLISDVVSNSEY